MLQIKNKIGRSQKLTTEYFDFFLISTIAQLIICMKLRIQ